MSKSLLSFKSFNDKKSQNYLADHFPKGKLTQKRFDSDSVLYKLILCLSTFIKIFTGQLFNLAKNIDIDKADELLTEWEASVKIPEKYPRLDTIEKRREAVKRKISKVPVYNIDREIVTNKYTTYEDYVKKMTDYNIQGILYEGYDFPRIFPFIFTGTPTDTWLTLFFKVEIVTNNDLPADFPVDLYTGITQVQLDLISNALEDVVPAYCAYVLIPVEEL